MADFMDKHFAAAGIDDNEKPAGGVDSLPGNGEDSNVGRSLDEPPPFEPNAEGNNSEPGSGQDTLQGGNGSDTLQGGSGDNIDGAAKPGKEEKGQKPNRPGDLSLPDGTVVKAGVERRWYETAQTEKQQRILAQQDLNTVRQQMQTLQTRYDELNNVAKQIGLEEPAQMTAAVRLYKDLQANPTGTVKQLLVDLKAAGYNIDGIGSGVDTAAINRLLDQRLGNQSSENGQGQQKSQAELDREAAIETAQFFTDFPDARLHEPFIAAVIEQHPGESLRDIYFTLKQSAIDQGFDWTRPLLDQVKERQQGGNGTPKPAGTQQQQQQNRDPSPLNGRPVAAISGSQEHDPRKIQHQSDDWAEAIRLGMKDAGYNIQ